MRKKAVSDTSSRSRRKRKRPSEKVAFKNIHVFSFILKGWARDALNELEVDESLNELVLNLWAQYLSKTKQAFVKPGKSPILGMNPNFRDFQVEITGRKRLISPAAILHYNKRQKAKAEKPPQENIDYFSDESTESRRRRNRVKRKFLNSFASDSSSFTEGDSSSSFLTSEDESATSSATSTDSDDENPEQNDIQMAILSKINYNRPFRYKRISSPEITSLSVVYAIFCYAVLLLDNNKYTLSDLLRFAENGVIAYKNGPQHVPPAIRIWSLHDLKRFTCTEAGKNLLIHNKMRRTMNSLGELLALKEVDFGTGHFTVTKVIGRFLKELALPKSLSKIICTNLEHSDLYYLRWKYQRYDRSKKMDTNEPIVSSDVRAIALILFALKYLYGLDDESETHKRSLKDQDFDICEWIILSRLRAFLACRFSVELHKRFKDLFDNRVKMTRAACRVAMKERRLMFSEVSNAKKTDAELSEKRRFRVGDKRSIDNVAICFKTKALRRKFQEAKVNNFDCKTSDTPLFAFAQYYAQHEKLDSKEDKPSLQDAKKLQTLLSMHKQKINLKRANPDVNLVPIDPSFVVNPPLQPSTIGKENECKLAFSTSEAREPTNTAVNYKPLYWFLRKHSRAHNNITYEKEIRDHLMNALPDSFKWVLQYFAAVIDVPPIDIYDELQYVETTLLKKRAYMFGEIVLSSNVGERHLLKHVSKEFMDKLTWK